MSKAAKRHLTTAAANVGTCSYSDVCCKNPVTNECVLMGNPPVGHGDVVLDHCPTAQEGASGLFSEMQVEATGRFDSCCKTQAGSVDWEYVDGTSTGLDKHGNTGCQRDNTCDFGEEACCYNTRGDHKCWIYDGLPKLEANSGRGPTGNMVGCPPAVGESGWVWGSDEKDGRNNGCCEEVPAPIPGNFRGQAIDGNPCFVEEAVTTTIADGTEFTGMWVGFMEGDTSDDVHLYADTAAAKSAGCHIGDWDSKAPVADPASDEEDATVPTGGAAASRTAAAAFILVVTTIASAF